MSEGVQGGTGEAMELRSIVAHALRQAFHATLLAAAAWAASSQPARATGPAQPLPAVNTPADVAVRTLEAGPFDGPALDDEACMEVLRRCCCCPAGTLRDLDVPLPAAENQAGNRLS